MILVGPGSYGNRSATALSRFYDLPCGLPISWQEFVNAIEGVVGDAPDAQIAFQIDAVEFGRFCQWRPRSARSVGLLLRLSRPSRKNYLFAGSDAAANALRTAKHPPIFHKLDETIRGHVFCSFLALVPKRALEDRIQQRSIGRGNFSPDTSWPATIELPQRLWRMP